MDKRFYILIFAIVVIIAAALFYSPRNAPITGENATEPAAITIENVTGPANGTYLNDADGNPTWIYLVNSSIQYGSFSRDYYWEPSGYLAHAGDPCIIVSGNIRNDYSTDYYVGMTAYVRNSTGERSGNIVNTGWGDPWFAFMFYHVPSKGNESFRIYVKYNKTDVKNYEINAIFTSVSPPP